MSFQCESLWDSGALSNSSYIAVVAFHYESSWFILVSLIQETRWYEETTIELMAPTLLPELHLLKRVKSGSAFCFSIFCWGWVAVNFVFQTHYSYVSYSCPKHLINFYCVSGEGKGTEILGTVCRPQQRHRAFEVFLHSFFLYFKQFIDPKCVSIETTGFQQSLINKLSVHP